MSHTQQIAMLNQQSFSGPAWHGPSVEEVIRGISADQAAARPRMGQHTIWQHVLHMIFWKEKLTGAMMGEVMPRSSQVAPEDNWPLIANASNRAWQNTLIDLRACEQRLQHAIAIFSEERLSEQVPGQEYDFAFALHGMPCHDTYHAAQIVLLKKAFP